MKAQVYAEFALEAADDSLNAARAATARRDEPGNLAEVLMRCIAPHIHENRQACIAEAAYFIAARRGFAPGHELDDWLEAENEVDARLIGECAY